MNWKLIWRRAMVSSLILAVIWAIWYYFNLETVPTITKVMSVFLPVTMPGWLGNRFFDLLIPFIWIPLWGLWRRKFKEMLEEKGRFTWGTFMMFYTYFSFTGVIAIYLGLFMPGKDPVGEGFLTVVCVILGICLFIPFLMDLCDRNRRSCPFLALLGFWYSLVGALCFGLLFGLSVLALFAILRFLTQKGNALVVWLFPSCIDDECG